MTLEEYVKEEAERLKAFEAFWRKGHDINADIFPLELSSGDWDDQFMSFNPESDDAA